MPGTLLDTGCMINTVFTLKSTHTLLKKTPPPTKRTISTNIQGFKYNDKDVNLIKVQPCLDDYKQIEPQHKESLLKPSEKNTKDKTN